MLKKVLIISYYWPPAGGPGVQRWLKFVKYLPSFGVEPIVYVPENPSYPITDTSLNSAIPHDTTVLKHPIREPYKIANLLSKKTSKTIQKGLISESKHQGLLEKLLLYIRGNFFIPDARKNWVSPSIKWLSEYIKKQQIDTIITTGPPHSLHLIGLGLKQQHQLRWLADFRDPWTTIGYHNQLKLTPSAQRKHKHLEQQVLSRADQIIVTSRVTKEVFSKMTNTPITTITNGYDDQPSEPVALDTKFTLVHIGSLLAKRNPENLWKTLAKLCDTHPQFAEDFELRLAGTISQNVITSIEKNGLKNQLKIINYLSHDEAIKTQKQSQILLLIEIDSPDTRCIIPGKLFEYMTSNRPIIALGPAGSDVETIIKKTNTGHYFHYTDMDHLSAIIIKHYKRFKTGDLKSHGIGLKQYHRKALTETLARLLIQNT